MGRMLSMAWSGWLCLLAAGCMTGPLQDNPIFVRPDPSITVANPIWVPSLGVEGAYPRVFERVLDILSDYFEIRWTSRYDGRIETFPRVSPGYEQIWKPGSPDAYQRLEATLQSIRHRAEVLIEPAADGGFFVHVTIYKELEDVPRPIRATAGAAAFRTNVTVERQFEVIDQTIYESNWIPMGRDCEMEQLILQRLKKCM
jgi:hypothetical protein